MMPEPNLDHNPAPPGAAPDAAHTIAAMLVGAPKAGTTSLYRYAVQHPRIAGHEQREMTYFFSDTEFEQGDHACTQKYWPGDAPNDAVRLAKHVFAMYRAQALGRLKTLNPDAHVFALLRDPLKRAYSSYWYSRRRGWDPSPGFEQAVQWELAQAPAEQDVWLAQRDRMHLRVGVYAPCIRRLFDTFGRDRVHVLLTEDLAQDAAGCCRTIYRAIGVDDDFLPDLSRAHNQAAAARSQVMANTIAGVLKHKGKVKHTVRRFIPHTLARRARHALLRMNEKPFTPPPMPPDRQQQLADYFKPHNQALAELIGRDLSHWGRTP